MKKILVILFSMFAISTHAAAVEMAELSFCTEIKVEQTDCTSKTIGDSCKVSSFENSEYYSFSCDDAYINNKCEVVCLSPVIKCNSGAWQNEQEISYRLTPDGYFCTGGCTKCPANAICNGGKTFTCKKNFANDGPSGCKCADKDLLLTDDGCVECPADSVCNGTAYFSCKSGFYNNNGKCIKCPANSDCDGNSTFKCWAGYYKEGVLCEKCPGNGTSKYNATAQTDCYFIGSENNTQEDNIGWYYYDKNCYYSKKKLNNK